MTRRIEVLSHFTHTSKEFKKKYMVNIKFKHSIAYLHMWMRFMKRNFSFNYKYLSICTLCYFLYLFLSFKTLCMLYMPLNHIFFFKISSYDVIWKQGKTIPHTILYIWLNFLVSASCCGCMILWTPERDKWIEFYLWRLIKLKRMLPVDYTKAQRT